MTLRFAARTLLLLAAALAGPSSSSRAETIVGPGTVAPISLDPGSYRFLNGTQIQGSSSLVGDTLAGGPAVLANSTIPGFDTFPAAIFDGGTYQGGSVTTQSGVPNAVGGNAIRATGVGRKTFEILGGTYRGGNVLVDAPASVAAGAALETAGGDGMYGTRVVIRGGTFEGGAVANMATPSTLISRAPAIVLGGASALGRPDRATVYAGQFTGGVDIRGNGQLFVLGTNLNIQPALIDLAPPYSGKGLPANSEVTLTGNYRNGSPFSIVVRNGLDRPLRTVVFPSSPSGVLFYTPEPAAASLFAFSVVFPILRRQRGR